MKREMFWILTSEWFNNLILEKILQFNWVKFKFTFDYRKMVFDHAMLCSYPGFSYECTNYKEYNKRRIISMNYIFSCILCSTMRFNHNFRWYICLEKPWNRYCNAWYISIDQVGSKLQILKNLMALFTCITLSVKIDKKGNVLICKSLLTSIYSTSFCKKNAQVL